MIGTLVNVAAIVAGSFAGIMIRGMNTEKFSDTVIKGIALCVVLIGISGALEEANLLLVIFSIVIGGVIGEVIDIDHKLIRFGERLEELFKGRGGKVAEGFVSCTLIYCVGAMAIVGALESGLKGDHSTLFAKSVLDGVSSIIFASTMGIGVMISAISVLIYQGAITLGAGFLKGILTQQVISDMSVVGSLLILGIGLNILGVSKIKIANLLPAILVPVAYHLIMGVI